ncbi:MAG: hypothetical protein AB7S51_03595 [Porticoccaceae bacterium]
MRADPKAVGMRQRGFYQGQKIAETPTVERLTAVGGPQVGVLGSRPEPHHQRGLPDPQPG